MLLLMKLMMYLILKRLQEYKIPSQLYIEKLFNQINAIANSDAIKSMGKSSFSCDNRSYLVNCPPLKINTEVIK